MLRLYKNILDGDTKLEKEEENKKKQLKSNLNEITRRNPKNSENQLKTIENIKIFRNQEKKLSNCLMIILKLHLKLNIN